MAFLLGGLLLLAWASLLFAFKLLCLDKIKYHFGRYSLGMIFAYGLLLLLYVASEHYPPSKSTFTQLAYRQDSRRDHLDSRPRHLFYFPYRERLFPRRKRKSVLQVEIKDDGVCLLQCVFGSIRSGVFFFPPERGHFFRVGDTYPSVSTVYPLGMAACFRGLLGADRPDCVARP